MIDREKVKKELLEWVYSIAIAFAAVFLLFQFVLLSIVVDGSSMYPTLQDKERVMAFRLGAPKQGSIVILSEETGLDLVLVKRVVAAEGQTVEITEEGIVLVDGEPLDEDFDAILPHKRGDHDYPVTVPEGHIFVLGDNRNGSSDSRYNTVGFVDKDEVLGTVFLRFAPLDRFGFIS